LKPNRDILCWTVSLTFALAVGCGVFLVIITQRDSAFFSSHDPRSIQLATSEAVVMAQYRSPDWSEMRIDADRLPIKMVCYYSGHGKWPREHILRLWFKNGQLDCINYGRSVLWRGDTDIFYVRSASGFVMDNLREM
jgi:hypothetical protein